MHLPFHVQIQVQQCLTLEHLQLLFIYLFCCFLSHLCLAQHVISSWCFHRICNWKHNSQVDNYWFYSIEECCSQTYCKYPYSHSVWTCISAQLSSSMDSKYLHGSDQWIHSCRFYLVCHDSYHLSQSGNQGFVNSFHPLV